LNPSSVTEVEAKLEALEKEKKSLQAKMTSLEDKIGGRDPHESFKDELHALKGSCFSVSEGKYDYEVCIHGKASQKDKGATSGTSLGRWKGMEIDEQTGDRVMKWTNGQSCWNGPERSATVIVKCGAETTLLSAEEPDTCTYLLQMESYIACDNTYFEKFNNSY
jgi:protein kinase C substrate 80K-H